MSPIKARTSWFTFGQDHRHELDGEQFGVKTVVEITALDPRGVMLALFGKEWCWEYVDPAEARAYVTKWECSVYELTFSEIRVTSV